MSVKKFHVQLAGQAILDVVIDEEGQSLALTPHGGPWANWWRNLFTGKQLTVKYEEIPPPQQSMRARRAKRKG